MLLEPFSIASEKNPMIKRARQKGFNKSPTNQNLIRQSPTPVWERQKGLNSCPTNQNLIKQRPTPTWARPKGLHQPNDRLRGHVNAARWPPHEATWVRPIGHPHEATYARPIGRSQICHNIVPLIMRVHSQGCTCVCTCTTTCSSSCHFFMSPQALCREHVYNCSSERYITIHEIQIDVVRQRTGLEIT